jgi:hypothetical protein
MAAFKLYLAFSFPGDCGHLTNVYQELERAQARFPDLRKDPFSSVMVTVPEFRYQPSPELARLISKHSEA